MLWFNLINAAVSFGQMVLFVFGDHCSGYSKSLNNAESAHNKFHISFTKIVITLPFLDHFDFSAFPANLLEQLYGIGHMFRDAATWYSHITLEEHTALAGIKTFQNIINTNFLTTDISKLRWLCGFQKILKDNTHHVQCLLTLLPLERIVLQSSSILQTV